ncbi:uncharacterized protein MKK02DRAFT_42599 [Dioszegia hungarica]|uniref:Peptidase A1 domain-containing protein n=1 Tax=Dioszegia hungarica TaxID=4972 RepID=A0AA38HD77_9TREE|nr:uncharacterized protein MKK02DRAFT_42599 [Dioszegia hungarica]KAI9638211.1 hypothetical protein MKK02DRAFT_42599 [Dioszegia hungarica]
MSVQYRQSLSPGTRPLWRPLAVLASLVLVSADGQLDATRLGTFYTDFPIYRSGSGTNVVKVAIGKPGVAAQLTLSTNVNFVQVASDQCVDCANGVDLYNPSRSSSWTSSSQEQVNVVIFPQMPEDTLTLTTRLGTDIVLDARGQDQVQNRQQSILSTMLNAENYPPNQPVPKNFVVGFDIDSSNGQVGGRVGSMHWGAAPQGRWVGEFNWYETNRTVGGSWGIPVENLRMGGNVLDTTQFYATIDPGFDGIYLPSRIAEQLFNNVQGVLRDVDDPRRWVQAWTNSSVAEEQGEIRLGSSFLSGIYSVIYYSPNQQFVGFAGKPGSVNDFNVAARARGMPNMNLAGILIGTLLGSLLILFIICYARNRSTFQSTWARGVRQIHRAQMNAVVRASTIPPPIMRPMPPMMSMPMGMGMGMGLGPGMGMGMVPPGVQGPGMMGPGYGYPQQLPAYPDAQQHPFLQQQASLQHQPPVYQQQSTSPLPSNARHHPAQSRHHSLPSGSALPYRPNGHYPSPPSVDTTATRRPRDRHSAPLPPNPSQHAHTRGSGDTSAHMPLPSKRLPPHPEHPDHHRFSRPEYQHAPPGSATSKSIWKFGKPESMARGYEAATRHASAQSDDGVHPIGEAGGDLGDPRGNWKEVERNREREGLTALNAWGRRT